MNWFRRITHSLSLRLLLIFVVATVLLVLAFRHAIGGSLREQYEHMVARDMAHSVGRIVDRRSGTLSLPRLQTLAERQSLDVYIRGPDVNWRSTDAPIDVSRVDFEEFHFRPPRRHPHARHPHRLPIKLERGSHGGDIFLRATHGDYRLLMRLDPDRDRPPAWRWLVLLSVFLAGLYLAIRFLFKPIEQIRRVVTRIGEGDLKSRTYITRRDELGDLGASINRMADDIESMLDSKRGLLLALSHELRTPVTRARVLNELLPESTERDAMAGDLAEMERIIADITEAERLSGRHDAVNREPVAVNELVESVLNEYFPEAGVQLRLPEDNPYVLLDPVRIRLLLKNLIENALRHSIDGRPPPEVRVSLRPSVLEILVEDFGEGIPAEHLSQVTDPFYRADPSRQRGTGGFGLGLYLCKNIAAAHDGKLDIDSTLGEGTRVRVTIDISSNR